MPFAWSAAIAFVYGTVVGSFLNVCIWRMPRDESIIHPPSHCPRCNRKLSVWENIPLLSFLIQRCKCRGCGERISWRYFGVELLTGVFFVALFARFHWNLEFFTFALFGSALIAAFFIDMEHWIIPDQLNLFGVALGIAHDVTALILAKAGYAHMVTIKPLMTIAVPFTDIFFPMLQSVVGILVCGGIFYLIAILGELAFKKEAMGGGDIKLAAAVGANLPVGLALVSFFVAVTLGSIVGIGWAVTMRALKKEFKSYVPFGPMMVAGAVVVMFFGNEMVNAYCNYLGYFPPK